MASASAYVTISTLAAGSAAILGAVALSTPHWHIIDEGATFHTRRGFFEECRVFSESRQDCYRVTFSESRDDFCIGGGLSDELMRLRHGWAATFAILAVLAWLVSALLPLLGWCRYSLLTIPSLVASFLGVVFMTSSISIFVNTYDGWYYCGLDYCSFAQHYLGVSEDGCFSSRGYSFVLAIMSIVLAFVSAFVSGMLVRATRTEKIDHQGNAITVYTKSVKAQLKKIIEAQRQLEVERTRLISQKRSVSQQQRELSSQAAERASLKALPSGSLSPDMNNSNNGPVGTTTTSSNSSPQMPLPPASLNGGLGPLTLPPAAPPPGGDWVWNLESGLYWSAKEFLYLDPVGKKYFDPTSRKWYDPVTEEWLMDQDE